jgi:hypothetical protein
MSAGAKADKSFVADCLMSAMLLQMQLLATVL